MSSERSAREAIAAGVRSVVARLTGDPDLGWCLCPEPLLDLDDDDDFCWACRRPVDMDDGGPIDDGSEVE